MVDQKPIKPIKVGIQPVGLGEFEADDAIGISDGGTGATTISGALENLGLDALAIPGGLDDFIDSKGQPDGLAELDGTGKVPISQLPDAFSGQVEYQEPWNASTNTPTIPAAESVNKGNYYIVTVAGSAIIDGINEWAVGDWIISNGNTWDKVDNSEQTFSFAYPPTVNDDSTQGFIDGSIWIDNSLNHVYICSDSSVGNAGWSHVNVGALLRQTGLVLDSGKVTVNILDHTKIDISETHYFIAGSYNILPAQEGLEPSFDNGENSKYIGLDINGVVRKNSKWTDVELRTTIPLARLNTEANVTGFGSDVHLIRDDRYFIDESGYRERLWVEKTLGALYYKGGIISEREDPYFRRLEESEGILFDAQKKEQIISSKVDPETIIFYHEGGAIKVSEPEPFIVPNDMYDDGTNIIPIPSGKWVSHTLLKSPKGLPQEGSLFFIYGNQVYDDSSSASAQKPYFAEYVDQQTSGVIAVASLIIQEGSTNINSIIDRRPSFHNIQQAAGGGTVGSVFGRAGDILAVSGDYTWAQVNKDISDIAEITTRSHISLTDIGTTTHSGIDDFVNSKAQPYGLATLDLDGRVPISQLNIDDLEWQNSVIDKDLWNIDLTDNFTSTTQHDIKTGGDGVKSYGWNVLNSVNADAIDINTTNTGQLTIDAPATDVKWYADVDSAPFVYKNITGNFFVETKISDNADSDFEGSSLLVVDPTASAGVDFIKLTHVYSEVGFSGLGIQATNNVNSAQVDVNSIAVNDTYFAIERVGTTFNLYSKLNIEDSWILRDTYIRADFASTVLVGLSIQTLNIDDNLVTTFDYFKYSNPVSPTLRDRYIIPAIVDGEVWVGHENDIAEYTSISGSLWDFITPKEGYIVWVEDEDRTYTFDGNSWEKSEIFFDHGLLQNVGITTHSGIDYFIATKGQPSGLASLKADGTLEDSQVPAADKVSYDNSLSRLAATNVKTALDEIEHRLDLDEPNLPYAPELENRGIVRLLDIIDLSSYTCSTDICYQPAFLPTGDIWITTGGGTVVIVDGVTHEIKNDITGLPSGDNLVYYPKTNKVFGFAANVGYVLDVVTETLEATITMSGLIQTVSTYNPIVDLILISDNSTSKIWAISPKTYKVVYTDSNAIILDSPAGRTSRELVTDVITGKTYGINTHLDIIDFSKGEGLAESDFTKVEHTAPNDLVYVDGSAYLLDAGNTILKLNYPDLTYISTINLNGSGHTRLVHTDTGGGKLYVADCIDGISVESISNFDTTPIVTTVSGVTFDRIEAIDSDPTGKIYLGGLNHLYIIDPIDDSVVKTSLDAAAIKSVSGDWENNKVYLGSNYNGEIHEIETVSGTLTQKHTLNNNSYGYVNCDDMVFVPETGYLYILDAAAQGLTVYDPDTKENIYTLYDETDLDAAQLPLLYSSSNIIYSDNDKMLYIDRERLNEKSVVAMSPFTFDFIDITPFKVSGGITLSKANGDIYALWSVGTEKVTRMYINYPKVDSLITGGESWGLDLDTTTQQPYFSDWYTNSINTYTPSKVYESINNRTESFYWDEKGCYCPINDLIYIPSSGENTIELLDAKTGISKGFFDISTGTNYRQIIYNPYTEKLYVVTWSEKLYELDPYTNTISNEWTTEFSGLTATCSICLNSDNGYLYITCKEGIIKVLDPYLGIFMDDISTGITAVWDINIIYNSYDKKIWVNFYSNSIKVFDPNNTNNLDSTIPLTGIRDLTLCPTNNKIYAVDDSAGAVRVIDPDTYTETGSSPILTSAAALPNLIYDDISKKIYVSGYDRYVHIIDPVDDSYSKFALSVDFENLGPISDAGNYGVILLSRRFGGAVRILNSDYEVKSVTNIDHDIRPSGGAENLVYNSNNNKIYTGMWTESFTVSDVNSGASKVYKTDFFVGSIAYNPVRKNVWMIGRDIKKIFIYS